MPKFRSPAAALIAASTLATGCLYYGHQTHDVDRTPIVDTGVGASILMPGQSAPELPRARRPWFGHQPRDRRRRDARRRPPLDDRRLPHRRDQRT